jgi:hypothetical protein
MKNIAVLVCIDVEPDEREIHAMVPKDWDGFEKTVEFFNALRPRLIRATNSPVRFCWFLRMDPQIGQTYGDPLWAARRYRAVIDQLKASGDAFGVHTHAWRWDSKLCKWIADHAIGIG